MGIGPGERVGTFPESLEAVLISSRVDHRGLLSNVRTVIVDELHAFAGDDRGWHLLALLERIERLVARRLQRLGLSATIGNADELLAWLARGRGRHVMASADGLALVVRNADVGAVAAAIDRVDPAAARPEVPPGLAAELKFSECLPPEIVATVVEARLSDRAAFDEALRRPRRVITAG